VQFALAGCAVFDYGAAPAKPESSGLVQGFAQGYSKATGGGLARIGKAVGDDDKTAHGGNHPC